MRSISLRRPSISGSESQRTIPQVIFRFALQVGTPLTGTTDPRHMREDVDVYDFTLSEAEARAIAEAGL